MGRRSASPLARKAAAKSALAATPPPRPTSLFEVTYGLVILPEQQPKDAGLMECGSRSLPDGSVVESTRLANDLGEHFLLPLRPSCSPVEPGEELGGGGRCQAARRKAGTLLVRPRGSFPAAG
jgi:hypothetical protein